MDVNSSKERVSLLIFFLCVPAEGVTAVYNLYELYGTLEAREENGTDRASAMHTTIPGKDDDSWLQVRRLTCLGRPNARRHEFLRVPSQMERDHTHGLMVSHIRWLSRPTM